MKKSTLAIAVVAALAIGYTGASWYVGKQAQATLEQAVQEANQQLVKVLGPDLAGNELKFGIERYQRGIFSSQVLYTLSLRDPQGNPIVLQLEDDLHHGPFPWAAVRTGDLSPLLAYSQSRLLPTPQVQPWFDGVTDKSEPLSIRTRVGLSRAGTSVWTFAPVALQNGNGTLQFSGGQLTTDFASNFTDGRGNGSFAKLDYTDNTGTVQVRDVALSSNTRKQQDVIQSESRVTANSLVIETPDSTQVALEAVDISFASEQQGQLLDGELRYAFGSVKAGGLDLGSFVLGLKGQRLDIVALTALAQQLDTLGAQDEDDALTQEQSDALEAGLLALLKTEPSLSLDPLSWKNDKGESRVVLDADLFAPQHDQDGDAEAAVEGFGLEYLRKAELGIEVSRDMFVRVFTMAQGGNPDSPMAAFGAMVFDQYASRLQSAGLAEIVDGKVTAKAIYHSEDASVELNGQRMPVEEFVQRVLLVTM